MAAWQQLRATPGPACRKPQVSAERRDQHDSVEGGDGEPHYGAWLQRIEYGFRRCPVEGGNDKKNEKYSPAIRMSGGGEAMEKHGHCRDREQQEIVADVVTAEEHGCADSAGCEVLSLGRSFILERAHREGRRRDDQ